MNGHIQSGTYDLAQTPSGEIIMYEAVLKSLDWQKEFYQIIVSVTDLVLTHIYMYSDQLTQKQLQEFGSNWNKFRMTALENIVVLISNLLIQANGHILCSLGLFIIRPVSIGKK